MIEVKKDSESAVEVAYASYFLEKGYSGAYGNICPMDIEKITRVIGYGIAVDTYNKHTTVVAIDDLYASYDGYLSSTSSTGIVKKNLFYTIRSGGAKNELYLKTPANQTDMRLTIAFIHEEGKAPLEFPSVAN